MGCNWGRGSSIMDIFQARKIYSFVHTCKYSCECEAERQPCNTVGKIVWYLCFHGRVLFSLSLESTLKSFSPHPSPRFSLVIFEVNRPLNKRIWRNVHWCANYNVQRQLQFLSPSLLFLSCFNIIETKKDVRKLLFETPNTVGGKTGKSWMFSPSLLF